MPAEIARREQPLAAIAEARARLEQRQREADLQRGRDENDERKPRDKHGKPKAGRYKRDFGVPEDKAQENFTDPDSRIMKRAGGGFDAAYNAHLAVDEAAQANLGEAPAQALADTGHRAETVFERFADGATQLVGALGREGKEQLKFDPERSPHMAAMAVKLQTQQGRSAYRKRKWVAEPPNGWIKNVLGFRQFSVRGLTKVQDELKIICAALNLRRMNVLRPA